MQTSAAVKHISPPTRFLAAAAVFAVLLAVPIGVLAHEHDQAESQCRICKVSGAETVVLHDGPAVPAPQNDTGLRTDEVPFIPDPPTRAPGAARAPPS